MLKAAINANTRASSDEALAVAKRISSAVPVPRSLFLDGVNRVAVKERANYAGASLFLR